MTFEYRSAVDYVGGSLLVAATAADTSMRSAAFTTLPSDYAPVGKYLPIALFNDAINRYEIVWVTGHSSSSDTVTVVRGKQGTTPLAWPSSTQFFVGPTARDAIGASLSTGLPTDPYIGERYALTDKGRVVERTKTAGWQPSVGVALPADMGANQSGNHPPADAVVLIRAGSVQSSTIASGACNFAFENPFPNGVTSIVAMSSFNGHRTFVLSGSSASGGSLLVFDSAGNLVNGGTAAVMYVAVGW
jgi:hypothetical protein